MADSLVQYDVAEAVSRENHKQSAAQSDEEMGAETGFLGTVLAFETNGSAKQSGNENTEDIICCHTLFVVFLCKDTKYF